jgi:ferrous iron transport protein B
MTILLVPFMSCSAKLPIYAVFTQAFFVKQKALVMMALYLMGILVGIIVGVILNKTSFKGNPVPFVMELPNYRFPSAKSVTLLMWDKAKDFLQKAFTVIFTATIIIWFLQSFDLKFNIVTDSSESLLAQLEK